MSEFTTEDIANYLRANPEMTDVQIADAMRQFNVSPQEVSQATGVPLREVFERYQQATYGTTQIPARPTFSGVAAAWNNEHLAKYGTFLNFARANQQDIANQIAELDNQTKAAQEAWDKTYGQTPEGKVIAENPPPEWRDFYENFSKQHVSEFGKIINRPWISDEGSINRKKEIDSAYIKAVDDYNAKYGTNIAPDPNVLGIFAQPNEFYEEPKKSKWYNDPFKVAAAIAAVYFGGQTVSGLLGEGAVGTGAFDAGIGLDAMLGGAGSSAASTIAGTGAFDSGIGLDAMLGGATEGTIAGTGAFDAGIGLDVMSGGQGLVGTLNQGISVPNAFETAMSGGGNVGEIGPIGNYGFGSAVPTTEQTAAALQAAGFSPGTAANLAGQTLAGVGAAVSSPTVSITDALRSLNSVRQLSQQQPQQQIPAENYAKQAALMGVDYSTLLKLLASQAKTTGLLGTRFEPQNLNLSLLG